MPFLDSGIARGGSTNTLTLSALASSVNTAYVGATIRLVSGTASGQSRTIIGYDGATKVATVSPWAAPYLDLPGSADDGALATLVLEYSDLGAGVAKITALFGTPTPTFTRATAAAAKLSTGLWKLDVASGSPRFSYDGLGTTVVSTTGGFSQEGAATQLALNPRDMTQAAWVAVNVAPTQVATGITGVANSATRLTSAAIGASILQTLVAAATSRTYSVWLRRVTGTGTITISQGATTLDVTASLNSSTFTRVELNASVLNSAFGITFGSSGDVIDADCNQFEAGGFATSPIPATGTRNTDVLTYLSTLVDDTLGTMFIQLLPSNFTSSGQGRMIDLGGSNTMPFFVGGAGAAYTMEDGTTTASGPSGLQTAQEKVVCAWSVAGMIVAREGTLGSGTAFDGSMNKGANIRIGASPSYVTNSRIVYFPQRLLNATLQSVTGSTGLSFKFSSYPTAFPDNTTGYEIDGVSKASDGDAAPSMVKPIGMLTRPKKEKKRATEKVIIPDLKSLRTPDVIPPQIEKEKIALAGFVSEEEDAAAQAALSSVLEQKRIQEEFIIAVIVDAINANRQASAAQRQEEIQQAAQMLKEIGADVESVAQAVQQLIQQREKLKQRSAEIQAERQAEEEEKAAEEAKAQASAAKEEKSASMFQRGITALQDAIKGMTQPSSKSITMTMPDGRKVSAEVKQK